MHSWLSRYPFRAFAFALVSSSLAILGFPKRDDWIIEVFWIAKVLLSDTRPSSEEQSDPTGRSLKSTYRLLSVNRSYLNPVQYGNPEVSLPACEHAFIVKCGVLRECFPLAPKKACLQSVDVAISKGPHMALSEFWPGTGVILHVTQNSRADWIIDCFSDIFDIFRFTQCIA